jgi:hypothetical protein
MAAVDFGNARLGLSSRRCLRQFGGTLGARRQLGRLAASASISISFGVVETAWGTCDAKEKPLTRSHVPKGFHGGDPSLRDVGRLTPAECQMDGYLNM